MIDIINNALNSEIVKVWIAPVITGSIVVFLCYIIRTFWKRKKVVKELDTIKIAETKLVDIVRPFYIKNFNISKDVLFDLRSSIIKEYDIDDKQFMTLKDLRRALIYDISNTMYIDEITKTELITKIYENFNFLNEKESKSEVEYLNFIETRKSLINRKKDLSDKLIILVSILGTILTVFSILIVGFPNIFYGANNLFVITYLFSIFISVFISILLSVIHHTKKK